MKYIVQFLIIVAFSLAGELLATLLPIPIPSSIYGIILLFVALETRWLKVEMVDEVSDFLIKTMPIMFVPPAVGLIDTWSLVRGSILEYTAVMIITTFVVMAVAGHVTQYVIRRSKKKQ